MPVTSTSKRGDKLKLTHNDGTVAGLVDFKAFEEAYLLLRVLNNPVRKKILFFLDINKNCPVSFIYRTLKMRQAHVSHELSTLRKIGVVHCTRVGKLMLYSINHERLLAITTHAKQML